MNRCLRFGLVLLFALSMIHCAGERDLTAITLIPGSAQMTTVGETVQLKAVGQFTRSPNSQEITDSAQWSSSDVGVATVNTSGLVTAVGFGNTTVIATSKGRHGALIAGSATINIGPVGLPTLTITVVGNGVVKSNPVAINCPGTCSAQFTLGTQVTLTATPNSGAAFTSWNGCDSTSGTTCTVTMNNFRTVTANFQ